MLDTHFIFFTFCMLFLFIMFVDHACIDCGFLSSTISFLFGIHNWLRHCFDYFFSDDIDKLGKVQSSFWKEWKLKLEEQKRFTHIVNHFASFGKIFPNEDLVNKVLRCLSWEWQPKVTAIAELRDLTNMSLETLFAKL